MVKNLVADLNKAHVEVFLSLGGWDYNCNAPKYCETLRYYNHSSAIKCDAPNYSYVCEPEG